jgi:hypothetical protein
LRDLPYCRKCGAQLDEDSRFCNACGQEVSAQTSQPVPSTVQPTTSQTSTEKASVESLVVGKGVSTENIIGVINSAHLHKGILKGYGLVIASDGVVGARKVKFTGSYFAAYLGRRSRLPDKDRARAYDKANDIAKDRNFELAKDAIRKITIKSPGILTGGHLIFESGQEEIKVDVASQMDKKEWTILLLSLIEFAPEKVYDEKTGQLLINVLK